MEDSQQSKRSRFRTATRLSLQRNPQLKAVAADEVLTHFAEVLGATVVTVDERTSGPPAMQSGGEAELCEAAGGVAERTTPIGPITPPMDTRANPEEIGEYQILDKLGSGGMGVVYRARKRGTDFEVALKVIPDALANDENCKKRLRQEANAASKLTHVNLVTVFEDSQQGTYIAMELVQGQNLAQLLEADGTLSLEQFQSIFTQVCDGLLHAHSKGVVHRDIKPGNILITPDGIVKIADFGIARTLEVFDPNPQMTATHTVVGTPDYMSPEQCLGQGLDVRSDIYSLGAVMFKALTGREVFEGQNPIQVIAKHLHEAPPSARDMCSSIPIPLAEIILRCLQKDPVQRYQDAGQVLLALKHADSKPKSRLPLKYRLQTSTKRPAKLAIASIVALAALFFGGWQLFHTPDNTPAAGPAQTTAALTVTTPPPRSPKDIEAEIAQWKLDLAKATEPADKVLYRRWIGDAYMSLVFFEPHSYSLPLDTGRKAWLLSATKYLKEAEALQLKINPNDAVLDNIYDNLQNAAFYLECESDCLKYSQIRAKFLERTQLMNDSLVKCYHDTGTSMSRLQYPKKQIIEAFRKSLYYDKLINSEQMGDYALPVYSDLVLELETGGRFSEALDVINEEIQRETARYGFDMSLLSYAYESKARVLDGLKRPADAKRIREFIKKQTAIGASSKSNGSAP